MRATTIVISTFCAALFASHAEAAPGPKWKKHLSWNSPGFDVHALFEAQSGRLGLEVIDVSPGVRKALGAPADHGVLINDVAADSPAAKAGVRAGDVLLRTGGERVESSLDIRAAVGDADKGDKVPLEVVRKGKRVKLTATLQDAPNRWDADFDMLRDLGAVLPGGGAELEKKLERMEKKLEALEKKLEKVK